MPEPREIEFLTQMTEKLVRNFRKKKTGKGIKVYSWLGAWFNLVPTYSLLLMSES